ncbi:MAG: 50S ribosomal protein L25 [Caldilineales bacterium]
MDDFTLQIEPRNATGHKARHLRAEGMVPAVIYGGTQPSQMVQLPAREFERMLSKGGTSNLLTLQGEGFGNTRVLIRELQRHPVRRNLLHVDFVRVASNQKITMAIPLHVVGHAPAIELGAMLLQNADSIEISCLPDDLPHAIEVDVTGMADVHDRIYARDLKLPSGVALAHADSGDEPVLQMSLSRAAAHADDEEASETTGEVEIINERRKDAEK